MTETSERAQLPGPRVVPAHDAESPSTGQLVGQLSEQLTRLVRDELRLAQLELQEKGKRLGAGAGMAGAAVVLAWFMVGALVCAAIAALALVLPVWASALIVAAALGVVAAVLGLVGKGQVTKGTPPIPEQAIAGSQRDVETIKERLHR